MIRNSFCFLFLLLISHLCVGQSTMLTLEEALKIALEKNYDVQITSNLSQIEKNNNTAGNAGMLPNIDVNGTYINSTNDLKQKYNTGAEVNRDGSGSTGTNVDLGLNWTVFDGLKMFYTKKKLDGLFYQSEQQLKIQIENTIVDVVNAYYTIIRNKQLLKASREESKLLQERMNVADLKLNNGSGSKLDQLQVKIEVNRQRTIDLTTQAAIDEASVTLNKLLARSAETEFTTIDTVIISYKPSMEDLKGSLKENKTLKYYELNQEIAELSLKENRSMRLPKVAVTGHYIYNRATNDAGLTLLNQAQGYNYGVTATLPLFHGFNINRQINNSKLDVLNARLKLAAINDDVNASVLIAYRNFQNSLEILKNEEDNALLAQEVLKIGQERFRIGNSSNVELQDAFRSYEESMSRLTDARFNSKILETELMRLSGKLVKTN